MVAPNFDVGGVEPEVWPVAFDRPSEEGVHPLVDLAAEAGDLALADPVHPYGSHQVIDGAGGDALDVGFLDDGRQRLLGHAARFEEARKVAAAAQLGDAQLHGAGPGLPVPISVAVALVGPLGAALVGTGAAERVGLELHEAFGGKADHLAQERRIGALLQQRAKGDLVIGHRGGPWVRVVSRNPTLPSTAAVTTAVDKSPAYTRLSAVAPAGDLPTAPTPRPGTRPSAACIKHVQRGALTDNKG